MEEERVMINRDVDERQLAILEFTLHGQHRNGESGLGLVSDGVD